MPDMILLELTANQASMMCIYGICWKYWNCYNYHNQYDYIISSICFIVKNLRSSVKSPRLKMLDDHVHNIITSLSLNKFLLSLSTHQNLFKLL